VPSPAEPTVSSLLLARSADNSTALVYGDATWSWRRVVQRCLEHAGWLTEVARTHRRRGSDGHRLHLGLLTRNSPESLFLLGGAALSGHVVVALDPSRSVEELARDIKISDCGALVAESPDPHLAADLTIRTGLEVIDMSNAGRQRETRDALDGYQPVQADAADPLMLVFTADGPGDPRALRITHRRIAWSGAALASSLGIDEGQVIYSPVSPAHSRTGTAAYALALASGAVLALAPDFTPARLFSDLRRYQCTYLHYTESILEGSLSLPPGPDETRSPLRVAVGGGASPATRRRFAQRHGCTVLDTYGFPEAGVWLAPEPDPRSPALGRLTQGLAVLHPRTGGVCPPGYWDTSGRLLNPEEAAGELVNTAGTGLFDGYYNDPAGNAERIHNGMYFSGDLVCADAEGRVYRLGRAEDWRAIVERGAAGLG
jgi:fatty-acyl-CoA synthase